MIFFFESTSTICLVFHQHKLSQPIDLLILDELELNIVLKGLFKLNKRKKLKKLIKSNYKIIKKSNLY